MKFFLKSRKNSQSATTLTNEEETLLISLNITAELGISIKNRTGNKIDGLFEVQMLDGYTEEPKLKGIKSLVDKKVTVPKMLQTVRDLQAETNFNGYHILSCGSYGGDKDYFIAAIKTSDKYECLRIFETNGINYDLDTNDIIAFFKKWETQANFSIIDADHDRVIIQVFDFNFDLDGFVKEALKFCPDFLSVVENEEQLKQYIIDRKDEVDFWWD